MRTGRTRARSGGCRILSLEPGCNLPNGSQHGFARGGARFDSDGSSIVVGGEDVCLDGLCADRRRNGVRCAEGDLRRDGRTKLEEALRSGWPSVQVGWVELLHVVRGCARRRSVLTARDAILFTPLRAPALLSIQPAAPGTAFYLRGFYQG